ncbi:hypothetical protein ACFX15_031638 [Malus domestica]
MQNSWQLGMLHSLLKGYIRSMSKFNFKEMRAWYWLPLRAKARIGLILDPLLMICDVSIWIGRSRWLVMCNEKEIRRLVGFARLGLTYTQEIVWFEEPPDLIQDILFEEGL